MEILFLLYLAHYLADYPLQTNWVYAQKLKSWAGGIYHFLGVILGLLICLAPFLSYEKVLFSIAFISIIHYFQDETKIIFSKRFSWEGVGYFLDQAFHIVICTIAWALFLKNEHLTPKFGESQYTNIPLILFFIGLILVTYFWHITKFVLSDEKIYKANWISMLRNALVYVGVWGSGYILFLALQV